MDHEETQKQKPKILLDLKTGTEAEAFKDGSNFQDSDYKWGNIKYNLGTTSMQIPKMHRHRQKEIITLQKKLHAWTWAGSPWNR